MNYELDLVRVRAGLGFALTDQRPSKILNLKGRTMFIPYALNCKTQGSLRTSMLPCVP